MGDQWVGWRGGVSVTYIWAPPVSLWQGWRALKHAGIEGASASVEFDRGGVGE